MNIESLYAPVDIDASSIVGQHCVFGYPKEERLRTEQQKPGSALIGKPVAVGPNCLVGNQVVVHEGVQVGAGCVVEDRVRIGYDSTIGDRTRIVYGAYLCDRVTVGADATVAGFICDGTTIGDRSTVMGELVHEYTQPHEGWWDVEEDPPVIEADSVVGYGAHVVGGAAQLRRRRRGRHQGRTARTHRHRRQHPHPGGPLDRRPSPGLGPPLAVEAEHPDSVIGPPTGTRQILLDGRDSSITKSGSAPS